jgi:muconolactone D-isomerase
MNRIQAILTIHTEQLPDNFQEIIKHVLEVVANWKEQGVLVHFFLRQTRNGAVFIFKDVDEDYELVEKLCDYAKKIWNQQHDIKIKGYEVEVCIQDDDVMRDELKTGKMGGVYSLLNDKWVKKPVKMDFKPNERMIKEKSKNIIMAIDDIDEDSKSKDFDELEPQISKTWKKIKSYRQSGLDSESGEFSLGNLVFKLLRRNGYIQKIMDMKRKLYDKQFK